MIYISIGYPMGFRKKQNEDELEYFMEIRGKFVPVTHSELSLWSDINSTENEKLDEKIVISLKEKGLVLSSNSIFELFDILLEYTIIRQGVGWVNEGKPCILKAENDVFNTTKLQDIIWVNGYGTILIKTIVEKRCAKDFDIASESFKRQFIKDIIELTRHSVIVVV